MKYTLDEMSVRAAERVGYWPSGPTVIDPVGGELAHRLRVPAKRNDINTLESMVIM
jgi:hypothetical protein